MHPGDIQVAEAIDVPEGHPLTQVYNCVVFSQKGARDLPSMLSGGDLDGDLYTIIWDESLIPERTYPPADYPRQRPLELDRPVTNNDIKDFFIEFMKSDQLGRISNLHVIMADRKPEGTCDPDCIKLAELASIAVDFSKSGIPVRPNLSVFMEKSKLTELSGQSLRDP